MPPKRRREARTDQAEEVASAPLVGAAPPAPAHPFECPICIEPCVLPVTALCGVHTFCRACLRAHVSGKPDPRCPCCRKPISGEFEVHPGIQEAIRQRADADKLALAVRSGFSPAMKLTANAPNHAAWAKLYGLGVPYDLPGAAALLRAASDGGHRPSTAMLAYLLYFGIGVKEDRQAARKMVRKAAESKSSDSFFLALSSFFSEYEMDSLLAMAEKGVAAAAVFFAVSSRSSSQRDELLHMAASQGDVYAMYEFGIRRFEVAGASSSERDRAVALVEAAAEAGLAAAQNWFGRHLLDARHPDAVSWLKKSALQDCIPGIIQLGFCYMRGMAVAPDHALAIELFERATEAGCLRAHVYIGEMCEKGRAGCPVDYSEAMRRYTLARDDCPIALVGIGRLREKGLGVPVDIPAALMAYKSAEDAGEVEGRVEAARLSALMAIRQLGAVRTSPGDARGRAAALQALKAVQKELAAELSVRPPAGAAGE